MPYKRLIGVKVVSKASLFVENYYVEMFVNFLIFIRIINAIN